MYPKDRLLGPFLFIIYVNDISISSSIFKFTMHADDATLSTTTDTTNENNCSTELINNELSNIHDWLLVNKLSLNVPKTKFMVFCMPQKKVVIPRLKIANTESDSVDRFKARRGSGFYEIFFIFANMSCLCIHLVTLFNLRCKKIVMEFFFM